MRKASRFSPALLLAMFALLLLVLPASGQDSANRALTIQGEYNGLTQAVRDMTPDYSAPMRQVLPLLHQHPVPFNFNPTAAFDAALQQSYGPLVSTTAGLNILGLGKGFTGYTVTNVPPDTNASVGNTQVVETVNVSFVIFSKTTGAKVAGPFLLSALFSGATNNCGIGSVTDPVVEYDRINGRWVITYAAVTSFSPLTGPFLQCISVSTTSDATGTFNSYAFDLTSLGGTHGAFNDYGKLGIWTDAYYMSFNEFDAVTMASLGASPCAFQGSAMRSGSPASSVCFLPMSSEFGLLPAEIDGPNLPVTGEPEFYVGSLDGSSHIHLDKFHVDFTTPSNSTFKKLSLTTAAYTEACGGGSCIPQPTGGETLESAADRMMFRAAYRKFTGTSAHESLVTSHTVVAGTASGIRWYEIRNPNGSPPVLFQQGTFAPTDGKFRWMPSIAMDKNGDMALGYSVSGTTLDPSIRFTGRVPTDPAGTMESEKSIVTGTGVQSSSGHRWGDYSSTAIDPGDDCTFWYAQEYIKVSGSFSWSTRLASFHFTTCH